jgi:hypothetical protein
MKFPVAAVAASVVLIGVSFLAVPAVASGAEYLAASRAESSAAAQAPQDLVRTSTRAPEVGGSANSQVAGDLDPLITAWGAAGLALFGAGATAVALSVRSQRKQAS